MEDFTDYTDQELIEEINIAAWAAVMHDGVLRTKAWERFDAIALVLRQRFPASDAPMPAPTRD